MTKAQRDKAFYVSLTLCGPRKKGKRGYLAGGGQCVASGREAKKLFKAVFKKLTGHEAIPW
jgi:hypothetical protein